MPHKQRLNCNLHAVKCNGFKGRAFLSGVWGNERRSQLPAADLHAHAVDSGGGYKVQERAHARREGCLCGPPETILDGADTMKQHWFLLIE
jgi:hypothetical protein